MSTLTHELRGRRQARRPVLAVVATPGTRVDAVRPLLRQLATRVDLRPLDQAVGRSDAAFATSATALRSVPGAIPAAAWVADAAELRRVATRAPSVWLSADPEAVGLGAVAVPRDALPVAEWPYLAPLVRRRWRAQLGLPDELVVAIEPTAGTEGDALTNLALAAAALVTGPMLASALALGTPVVTTPGDASRLGLRDDVDVDVADPARPEAWSSAARALAADEERAARLSWAARRFIEASFDLDHIADAVLGRLGLTDPDHADDAHAILDRYLAELRTPPRSAIRARAAATFAPLVPSVDRS